MSLGRRIALASALAVAAVAVAISIVGYISTRSHLINELKGELWVRARPELGQHRGALLGPERPPPGRPQGGEGPQPGFPGGPPHPRFGAAPGYFQVVRPDGTVVVLSGETARLPVGSRVLTIARRGTGSFFTSATVQGVHLEVLTVGDRADQHAIQVALPLTSVDSVLNGLLLPYGLLIGGGILVALLLGAAVSRSALAPIGRFLRRTEDVTSELDRPRRLEESGASELRRLAGSFNQTLDALERSIQSQRNLVADASHELRTPIAALRSNIQIFLDSERLPTSERSELQESILAELDELTQLVDNVVELARGPTAGSQPEPVELDLVIREAVERARRRAPRMDFSLELEPTVVSGSPDRIARAISNLIDNARKWSPPEGTVEVRLHGGTVSIRDQGPGFDERDLPHVFDRFYRAADARRLPGSGLGLAIVSQAARAHGGTARAMNGERGGAVVEVSFGPAVEERARTATAR